jgi:hypothetical protein
MPDAARTSFRRTMGSKLVGSSLGRGVGDNIGYRRGQLALGGGVASGADSERAEDTPDQSCGVVAD